MTLSLRLSRHRFAVCAVVVAMTVTGGVLAPVQVARADIAQDIKDAKAAVADTKSHIKDVQQDIDDADAELAALDDKAEQAAERYNQARDELHDVSRKAEVAQARVDREKAAVAEKQKQVDSFVVAAYQGGGVTDIAAFLSGGTAQDTIDRLDSLGLVARNQEAALADLEVAKHRAADAEVAAGQIVEQQKAVTARVAKEKAAIAELVDEQGAVLDRLEAKEQGLVAKAEKQQAHTAELKHAQEVALAHAREVARKLAEEIAARKAAQRRAAAELERQRQQDEANNNSNNNTGPAGEPDPDANGSNGAQIAVKWAYAQLGKPYVWGADGPYSFDCSGLTQYVWAKAGVYLPHFTGAQWNSGRHISFAELQPGDLIFFHPDHHHMGMYIGNGQMIHAPHTGDVVRVAPAWRSNFSGAVRVG